MSDEDDLTDAEVLLYNPDNQPALENLLTDHGKIWITRNETTGEPELEFWLDGGEDHERTCKVSLRELDGWESTNYGPAFTIKCAQAFESLARRCRREPRDIDDCPLLVDEVTF